MKFIENVINLVEDKNKNDKFSGVVVIKRDNEEILSTCCGYANRTWKVENKIDTRFRIASITKMFTAVAILKLIEEGKFELDTKVVEYLELKDTKIPQEVTIYNLLTHTSGIADYYDEECEEEDAWEKIWREKPIYTMKNSSDYFSMFAYEDPVSEVGGKYHYNGAGYILLGMLIEKASGLSYFEYIKTNIFSKIGMNDSDFLALDEVNERASEGYEPIQDENEKIIGWRTNVYTTTIVGASDGGANSTAEDLIKFSQALRNGEILSEKMTKEMLTPHVLEYDEIIREYMWKYGFGNEFILDKDNNIVRYGHTGEEYGVSCRLYHYPTKNLDVVILGNQGFCAGALGWEIHDMIMELDI